MCRSGMEHFIMSVKHRERCTELADNGEEGRGAERWSHSLRECAQVCFVLVFYGSLCGANQKNPLTYVHPSHSLPVYIKTGLINDPHW